MITPIFAGIANSVTPSNSVVNYCYLVNAARNTWTTDETILLMPMPFGGTITKMNVQLTSAPAGTGQFVFALRQGQSSAGMADTTMTVTISGSNTTGSSSNTVTFVKGDLLSISSTPTNTPTSSTVAIAFTLSANANQSLVIGAGDGTLATGATNFSGCFGPTAINATELNVSQICSTAGTFKNLYVYLATAPGVGTSYACTVVKNGTPQTLTCTITGSAQTNFDNTNSFTVTGGDLISMQFVPSGTPTGARPSYSIEFDPTTDGESMVSFGGNFNPSTTANNFNPLNGGIGWNGTEANRKSLGMGSVTMKNIYINAGTAPGAGDSGKSYKYALTQNTTITALAATLLETALTANDTSDTISLADTDIVDIVSVPTSTPTQPARIRVGMTAYVVPASSSVNSGFFGLM